MIAVAFVENGICGKLVGFWGSRVSRGWERRSGGICSCPDEMPKGTLSLNPPSFGFYGSEKTQDAVGQAACETRLFVLVSLSERHHRAEKQ